MIIIKVAEMMGKHKLNQKAVSDMTGIRPNTVSMLWHGTLKRLDMEQLDGLCKAFNCQPGDLLEWVPNDEGS
jgi:putative transcriptional regulator